MFFNSLANKHAPFKKHGVKNRLNPWFTPEISEMLRLRDVAWAKAQGSKSSTDWQIFRQLRNK